MTKFISLPYKMLIADIETSHLKARIWRPGDQVVRHDQLIYGADAYEILTISYKWYGEKKVHTLDFTDEDMLAKFDEQVRKADVMLGKNSDQFDVKHLNTQRMLKGNKPLLEWQDTNEDLEKQLRKYFAFPSQSLDYVSKLLGFGGKDKMERQDWVDIEDWKSWMELGIHKDCDRICKLMYGKTQKQLCADGTRALKKMIKYNQKDVLDTESVLKRVLPYIKLKHHAGVGTGGCILCNSNKIVPTKVITVGQTKYQVFECLAHGGYAGKSRYRYDKSRHKVFEKLVR